MKDKDPLVANPLEQLAISESGKQMTYASALLTKGEYDHLRQILCKNKDMSTWKHSDILRINPAVAFHKLNIIPIARPVWQKVQRFYSDWTKII